MTSLRILLKQIYLLIGLKMFNKFFNWMNENNSQVSWFFIGYFLSETLSSLLRGDYVWAVWSFALVILNYIGRKPWVKIN
jgi:hypothetical protein